MIREKIFLAIKIGGALFILLAIGAKIPVIGVYQENIISRGDLFKAAETGSGRHFNCSSDQLIVSYLGPSKGLEAYSFVASIWVFYYNLLFAIDHPTYWKLFKVPLTFIGHHRYRENAGSLFHVKGCGLSGRLFCRYGVPEGTNYGCDDVEFDRVQERRE